MEFYRILKMFDVHSTRVGDVYEEFTSFFSVYTDVFHDVDYETLADCLGMESCDRARGRCKACGEMDRLEVDDSYWICQSCSNTWYCDDYNFQSEMVQDSIRNPDWNESTHAGTNSISQPKPYHATDNFERYLNSKAQGWMFTLVESDRQTIVDWIRSCPTDPNLTQFRSFLTRCGLEKHWQRRAQFMALAFPERSSEWLVMIPSKYLIKIKRAHRKLAYEFYNGASQKLGLKCFPHRGFTAAYLLFKWPETHVFIQYLDLPRLRSTAEKRRGHLWFMEHQLQIRPHSQPLDMSPLFPIHLFYDHERVLSDKPSVETLLESWNRNTLVLTYVLKITSHYPPHHVKGGI